MKKPLKHPNNHLFFSSNHSYEGAAVSSLSSAWMVDEFLVEPRELEYLQYEESAVSLYEEITASQAISDHVSMKYARTQGVENQWEMYSFFSRDDINAPTELFIYIDDEGNESYFNKQEQQQIKEWHPGDPYPIKGIEGHHVETIKDNPADRALAADPNNILLATEEGHLTHLHGGSTKNSTSEAYMDTNISNDEKLSMTLEYNKDLITIDFWEQGLATSAGSAGIYVTASVIIGLIKLKDDPRPWADKKKELAASALFAGLLGAGTGFAGHMASAGIMHLVGEFSIGGIDTFFESMAALNGAFFAVSLLTAGIAYLRLRHQGESHEKALQQYKSLIITATAELAAFSILGIGIDIGLDALGGLVIDAMLPDPTGVLIAARVTYSLFKAGMKYKNNQKQKAAFEECRKIRQNYYHNQALDSC